jgi:hypothetical protein
MGESIQIGSLFVCGVPYIKHIRLDIVEHICNPSNHGSNGRVPA